VTSPPAERGDNRAPASPRSGALGGQQRLGALLAALVLLVMLTTLGIGIYRVATAEPTIIPGGQR
jgi:hypothetical protein